MKYGVSNFLACYKGSCLDTGTQNGINGTNAFTQFVADNVDHNVRILWMGMKLSTAWASYVPLLILLVNLVPTLNMFHVFASLLNNQK